MKRITLSILIISLIIAFSPSAFASSRLRQSSIKGHSSNTVIKIYAGNGYTIGLCGDGSVRFAGERIGRWNLSDVETWKDIDALFIADSLAVGKKTDGSYISNAGPIDIPGELIALEMGVVGEYVFLTSDGRLYHTPEDDPNDIVLQYDGRDQLGLEYPLWRGLKGIEIGSDSAFGLRTDGTVITCPSMYRDSKRFREIESWTDIAAISMGRGYIPVGIKNNGTVVTVQADSINYGVDHDTSSWRSVIKICSENNITVGLRSDGRVYATGGEWGRADYISQIEKWTDIIDIAISDNHAVALRSDGTLVAAGSNDCGQCNLENW